MSLLIEIQSKCTPSEISARDHDLIAAKVNIGRVRRIEVEAWRAQRYFIKRGKWRAIHAAAANSQHPATIAAQAAVDLSSNADMMVDFADPDAGTQAMWGALVLSGLCTDEERNEITGWCIADDHVTPAMVAAALDGGI